MTHLEKEAKKMAELLKVLANENRLLILCQLIKEPQAVGKLAQNIPITQPALSQHLALLKAHAILDCSKAGQSVTYRIIDERVKEVIAVLKQYYCSEDVL